MSGTSGIPFKPFLGLTKNISVTTSTAEITISGSPQQLVLTNTGTVVCFVRWGVGTQTAVATTDLPILPGSASVVSCPGSTTNVAAITASGSTTLYVTPGNGE